MYVKISYDCDSKVTIVDTSDATLGDHDVGVWESDQRNRDWALKFADVLKRNPTPPPDTKAWFQSKYYQTMKKAASHAIEIAEDIRKQYKLGNT